MTWCSAAARGGSGQHQLIVHFQQTCGPVMAKGVEDTAFYRWTRLIALNEVGGDPDRFGVTPEEFHGFAGHLARHWPATMTTLSTHDTKRGEDVRARLAVLAESAQEWRPQVERWHDRAVWLSGGRSPEPHIEYLLWQTLVGAWPIDGDRLAGYLRKAMREAKTMTSWTEPDTGYESLVLGFADKVLRDGELTGWITGFVAGLAGDARVNSLGAKLVQLTMPGVADIYQGCELGAFSLVDPDNRRPVDFARRRQLLATLDAGRGRRRAGATTGGLDADKLLVTSAALRLRREHPGWFAGDYRPLDAEGPAARHAVSFLRGPSAGRIRRPRGDRRHQAARRAAAAGRLGGHGAAAAGRAVAGRADRRHPCRPAPAPVQSDQTISRGTAGPRPPGCGRTRHRPGAAPRGAGVTAFRVWAPAAGQVEVQALGDWHPMSPAAPAGWWEADVGHAPGGTDYAFRLDGGPPLPDPRSPRQPFGPQGVSRSYDHSAFALDRPRLAGNAAARVGDLRAAPRHVHPGGNVRRGDRAAGPPAATSA